MEDKGRLTTLLASLCENATSIQNVANAIDTHTERDSLYQLFEQWSRDAQHFLVVGLHKAQEHDYNETSIQNNVTGHARFVALSACEDSQTGYEVLWKVLQRVAEEEKNQIEGVVV